jgi:hypothetical protein
LQHAVCLAEPNSALGQAIQEFEPTTAIRAAIDRAAHSSTSTGSQKGAVRAVTALDPSTTGIVPVTSVQSERASPPAPAAAQEKREPTLGQVFSAAKWVVDMPETCVDGVKGIAIDTVWTVGACSLYPVVGASPCAVMTGELLKTTALTSVQCLLEGAKNTPGIPKPVSNEELLRLPVSCLDGVSDIARGAVLTIAKCTLAGVGAPGSASSCLEEASGWTITIGKGAVVCLKEAIPSSPKTEVKDKVPPSKPPRPAPKAPADREGPDAGRTAREVMMGRERPSSDRPAPQPRERPAPQPREQPARQFRDAGPTTKPSVRG